MNAHDITGHAADADGAAERAMDALRRIVRALRVSTRAVERELGISAAQLFVLRQLAAAPGQSLSHLAARTLTHQSTISEVVGRLVERGFVVRRRAADDARRAELALSDSGRELLARAPETVQERLVAGFNTLPVAQRRALADTMEAWLAASGLSQVPASLFFEKGED